MVFDNSYFEDEVRDGFYVPCEIKRAWAAQLEVLNDIDKVCRENGIEYFAEWGTLLGAVRHKGFIPWDDDMDISMKRHDYEKFLRIAKDKLPEGYDLYNIRTDKNVRDMLSRVINGRQIDCGKIRLEKYHDFPYVVGVDIFPLDYISRNEDENELQQNLIKFVAAVAAYVQELSEKQDAISQDEIKGLSEQIQQVEALCGMNIDRNGDLVWQLNSLIDKLSSIYREDEADYITIMALWNAAGTFKFPKEYYTSSMRIPFENTTIPVPVAYDAILRARYGDYMKLVRNVGGHDYPFFSEQKEQLKRAIDRTEYSFSYDAAEGSFSEKFPQSESVVERQITDRREVVIMTYKADEWKYAEQIWKSEKEKPDTDVYVLVMPYYYKDFFGNFTKYVYEGDKYDKELNVICANDFDIEIHHPDVIYTQNPYDGENAAISVSPELYSDRLKKYTDCLVYIQSFELYEFQKVNEREYKNMSYYCTVPGVVNADITYVLSENMRQMYITKLTEFAGSDTEKLWQDKIQVTPYGYQVSAVSKVFDNDKKTLLIYNTPGGLIQNSDAVKSKYENLFDKLPMYKESINVLWCMEADTENMICNVKPELIDVIKMLTERFENEKIGRICTDNDEDMVLSCDAYYGDVSAIIQKFTGMGKPVMLADYNIIY